MDKQRFDIIIGMQTGEITKGVKAANGDLKALKSALKDTLSALPGGKNITKELQAARDQVQGLVKELTKLQQMGAAKGKTNLGQFTPRQQAVLNAGIEQAKKSITNAVPSNIIAQQEKAMAQLQSKAITLRYAMYDVGSAANSASQALLNYSGAIIEAQIAQEQAFSQIEKTQVGAGSPAEVAKNLAKVKDELIALSTQVPISFSELTKIGMLGAQLGVASKDIAGFTEVTAKFSAITGMSSEDAAMGMGKVANLLGLQSDQYQALGSAIAGVGVQAAATESQILSTAGQIGAIAKAAGLSATDIIGLSSAMASLKIAPEEARGVIQPTFAAMSAAARSFNKDIGTGSEQLRVFAQISGMTSEEFATRWGSKSPAAAGNVWRKFLEGLGRTDASAALVKLGLDGVRTSKGLTALGNNAELVGKQMNIALTEGTKGTFLDLSYATVADDLAAKLKMLENSFNALAAAAAGNAGFLGLLKGLADMIKYLNVGFTKLLESSSFLSGAAGIAIALAGIGGALLAVVAAASLAFGGFLALKTAMQAAITEGLITKGTFGGVMASLYGLVPAQRAAATGFVGMAAGEGIATAATFTLANSLRVLKLALVSTGIGALVVAIGFAIEAFMNAQDASAGTAVSLNAVRQGAKAAKEDIDPLRSEIQDFIDEVLRGPAALTDFNNALFKMGQSVRDNGKDFSDTTEAGRANLTAFRAVLSAMFAASNGSEQAYANSLLAYVAQLKRIGLYAGQVKTEIETILSGLNYTIDPAAAKVGFKAYEDGLNSISTGAGKAKTALEKLDEILQKVFKGYNVKIGLMDSLEGLGKSIADNGKAFGYGTSGMRANLKALEDTISAFKESSNGDLAVFRGNLLSLRTAMQRLGITSGPALTLINAALAKTGTKGKASAKDIAAIFNAISGSIKKNAQTISDYVSDLNTALSDAFSNRYGTEEAMDRITSSFNEMKSAAADAQQAIADAQAEISSIRADSRILEYQLSVAVRYGDTLRADAIRSKLAKANADVAQQQKTIADNQQTLNRALTGNSASAVENRAKLRELIQSGNSYLLSLAQSGKSSEYLKGKAKELADQFMAQGKALGFAESELQSYLNDFVSDFTTVVDNVPKDINITVNSDPALEAVKKFVNNANALLSGLMSKDINIATGVGTTTTNSGATTKLEPSGTINNSSSTLAKLMSGYAKPTTAQLASYRSLKTLAATQLKTKNTTSITSSEWSAANAAYTTTLAAMKSFEAKYGTGYSTGGFVSGSGTATSDSIPARLSSGEYVVQANAVRYYGTDFMNALNNIQVQRQSYSGANSGDTMVYLSPEDRQLLRSAIERPINLYADSKQLASTVSTGNVSLARRGLN